MKKVKLFLVVCLVGIGSLTNAQEVLRQNPCCSTEECQGEILIKNINYIGLNNGEDRVWSVTNDDLEELKQVPSEEYSLVNFPSRKTLERIPVNPTYIQNCNHLDVLSDEYHETQFELVGRGVLNIENQVFDDAFKTKKVKVTSFTEGKIIFHIEYAWYAKDLDNPIFYILEKHLSINGIGTIERSYFLNEEFENLHNSILSVSPNPVSRRAEISIKTNKIDLRKPHRIVISNYQNLVIKQEPLNQRNQVVINTDSYTPGTYTIKLMTDGELKDVIRFVKL